MVGMHVLFSHGHLILTHRKSEARISVDKSEGLWKKEAILREGLLQ